MGDTLQGFLVILFKCFNRNTATVCMVCVCVCVFLQVRLEWPTDLAINPLDNSLYILDNNIVLQVLKTHTHATRLPMHEFCFFERHRHYT